MATKEEKKAAEEKKLAEAKEAAKAKVGDKVKKTVDDITFKKNSGSGIVFGVLDKAKKPLTIAEITERAVEKGLKSPSRAKTVADWFANNGIAMKDEKGCYALVPKKAEQPATQ